MMKWRIFLEGHRFTTINCDCTFEVDVKKVDLNAFVEGESPKHREKVKLILVVALSCCRPVLSSSSHCAALSLSNCAGWLLCRLSSRRTLVFLSRRTLVLLSSSHCAALSSSHRAVWLLRRPLSRRGLVLLSSSHS